MIEPEIAFADLLDDMNLAEAMVKYVINYVLDNAAEEINFCSEFVDKGLRTRLQTIIEQNLRGSPTPGGGTAAGVGAAI
jgi:asparaginyl-tRNA synthetase